MKKRILRIALVVFIAIFSWGVYMTIPMLEIAAAYNAKIMCSCVFVSGRSQESVEVEDLGAYSFIRKQVDEQGQKVIGSILGIKRTAIYREGLGCTLDSGLSEAELRAQNFKITATVTATDTAYWPTGDVDTLPAIEGIDQTQLKNAMDAAFAEPFEDKKRYTRAALVVYKDKIIAERYAEGIDQNTPLLGWSMTKSVTNAFVGILAKAGKLDIHAPAPVPEWQVKADDPRKPITINNLFHMASGLHFEEVYSSASVVNKMLWLAPDAAAITAEQPLAYPINTEWYYSSGTTNIISRIVRDQFDNQQAYLNFPSEALFNPLGMKTAIIEPDPSGTFVGSSLMYASARDWARFGLLYLYDGVWEGQRILPEGWVSYSATRAPALKEGFYAAHFWTNALEDVEAVFNRKWEGVPEDAFYASGFEGQNVVIIPSRDIVIVRLGLTADRSAWDIGVFVADVLKAIPN